MPSCAARCGVAGDERAPTGSRPSSPARCAQTIAMPSDVEALALGAVGVQQDRAVGQHAVDVEQHQPDRRAAFAVDSRQASATAQNISVRQRSCRCTTPATRARAVVDDDDRRDLALLHDVQRLDGERRPARP